MRRTKSKHKFHSYLPCTRCYGFFHKYDLWRHICPCDDSLPGDKRESKSCLVDCSRCLLDGTIDSSIDKDLKKHVLNYMRQDETYNVDIVDDLILRFGSSLLKRVGAKGRRRIYARMRLLAVLLHTLRDLLDMPATSLSDFIDGKYFDAVIEAVEKISGAHYDGQGHRVFQKPSIVAMIGNMLMKCCGLKKGLAARVKEGDVMSKEVDSFITLFRADWSDCMSCPATASQKASYYNKPDILPTTDDLLKLKQYTERRLDELTNQLAVEPCHVVWRMLSEVVLACLLVFNKRRASEPAKMLLSQFVNRPNWHASSNQELINNVRPL